MSERASPVPEDTSIFGRVKQAVGFSPKEHRLDIEEHETDVSPRAEDVSERKTTTERTYFEEPGHKGEHMEREGGTRPHAGKSSLIL